MTFKPYVAAGLVVAGLVCVPRAALAQDVPADYQQVLSALGKKGDVKDGVLKVNIPRNDVKVTVAGVATPTPFGFGGWVAMSKGEGGHEVLMGDLDRRTLARLVGSPQLGRRHPSTPRRKRSALASASGVRTASPNRPSTSA